MLSVALRASFDRRIKPRLRCADAEHTQRATHQRQHDCIDTHRTGSEHEHRVANLDVAALNRVKRSRQAHNRRP